MRPLGIDHIGLTVHDLDSALDFYVGRLGLRVRGDRPDFPVAGAWLDAAGQQVHLIVADDQPGSATHFALRVGNVDAVVGELRAAGIEVSEPVGIAASRQAFTVDPFGNAIELHQRPLTARRPETARVAPVDIDFAPPDAELRALHPRLNDLPSPNVRMALAQHPGVAEGFRALASEMKKDTRLPERERELLILRTAWRTQSVYEWAQHQRTAGASGIDSEDLRALAAELELHEWGADDRALLTAADELCSGDCVGDSTWADLAGRWDTAQLVEIVFVVGMYRALAGFLNSAGVELDAGLTGWPE